MPKSKKMQLSSLQLQQHPTLMTLHSDDKFTQSTLPNIQFLSIEQLQCLLNSCPTLVLKTEKEGLYILLATMTLIEIIRSHGASLKQNASLIIYDEAESVISPLTLIKPALLTPEFRSLSQQLHIRQCKATSVFTP